MQFHTAASKQTFAVRSFLTGQTSHFGEVQLMSSENTDASLIFKEALLVVLRKSIGKCPSCVVTCHDAQKRLLTGKCQHLTPRC